MTAAPDPVLFLIQHLDQGGTERHFHDLVLGLDHQRIQPHVIHFNDLNGLMARELAARPEVRTHFEPLSKAISPSAARAGAQLVRYLWRHRIACVVTFHFVADFLGTLAAQLTRTPVISSRRDMGFTRTARQLRLGRLLARGVTRYIAVSAAVAQAVAADEGVAPERIEVIHNGIDLETFRGVNLDPAVERARLGLSPEAVVLGCVANFNPVKDHLTLIESFARLKARYRGSAPLRLLLVGEGPLQQAIEQRIAALGLAEQVVFAGLSRDVRRELCASDLFVLPSETEGFSNAIVQAMAFSLPVVACRVGGNPEAVVEGETGLLVRPRDPEDLARALEQLVADPAARRRMGQAGARRAQDAFRCDQMLQRTEELIWRVIAQKGRNHRGQSR